MEKLGVGVNMEGVRRAGTGGERRGDIWITKVSSEEEKRKMQNKWRLKGEKVWKEEDLTWEEMRMRWKIR